MFLTLKAIALPARGGALRLATAAFAAGFAAGALIAPVSAGRCVAGPAIRQLPMPSSLRGGHAAEVLRVFDGDTFEARVRIWPGMDVTTKVRLRGIDAPELRARCAVERVKAIAARDALAEILSEGAVGVAGVTQDKYGGRVDASVSTAATGDVSAALLARGLVRHYSGRRRQSWCG
jgi:endonuclease YncB( thermonuclease family)